MKRRIAFIGVLSCLLASASCVPSRATQIQEMNLAGQSLAACYDRVLPGLDAKFADPDIVIFEAKNACEPEYARVQLAILPLRNNDVGALNKEMERIRKNMDEKARVYVLKRDQQELKAMPEPMIFR